MSTKSKADQSFNIVIIGHKGRLQYEALLFVASLRHSSPDFKGRMIVAEPKQGPLWPKPIAMDKAIKDELIELGAEILPFESKAFGLSYPYGNKIECLEALPEGEPFVFFDSDTLITGDIDKVRFDWSRPSASMRREGTWPVEELYWPGYTAIWKSLYDKFGLDFESSLDLGKPDEYWERYLYFNAGWFYGSDPKRFGETFFRFATEIRKAPTPEMVIQPLDPWLDQVALPLVIHALGGGRPGPELDGLDGDISCHYRMFPLLYARESDRAVEVLEAISAPNRLKKVLKEYEPIKRMIYQGRGEKVRALFDRNNLPPREQKIRNILKAEGFWMR